MLKNIAAVLRHILDCPYSTSLNNQSQPTENVTDYQLNYLKNAYHTYPQH